MGTPKGHHSRNHGIDYTYDGAPFTADDFQAGA